ncbi:uncharacterized protein LOC110974965 [Acanthaster planci]|uniref:Uncharacterized protein LOC110974965 n=1 Tax=Acanthaster planci TaxID=133434 RepID=A0A8B7XPA3_ACAPL|nr:uncharacterized protein LOC110974965 [Acanthaster planci]
MQSTEPGETSRGNSSSDGGALSLPPVIQDIAQGVLAIVVGLNSLGYSWIILTTIRHRQLRAVSNFFLVNLCVGELLFCTVLVPVAYVVVLRGHRDIRAAEINAGIVSTCVFILSGFFLSASVWVADKNLKLFKPFLYPRLGTNRYLAISVMATWASALAVASFVFLRLVTAPNTKEAVNFPAFILQNWWVPMLLFDGIVAVNVGFITLSNVAVIRLAFTQLRKINSRPTVVITEPENPVDRQQDVVFNIHLSTETISNPSTQSGTGTALARSARNFCRPTPRSTSSNSRRRSFIVYACTFTMAWTPAIVLVNLHAFGSLEISPPMIGCYFNTIGVT